MTLLARLLLLDQTGPVLGSAVDTGATVAVAIGTIGTVVYALFRDVFMTRRRRPKLELRFDGSGSDRVFVKTAGGEAAYIRLRVANGGGRDTADDVVVLVTEIRRLEDKTTRAEATPVLLPLTWSGSSPPLTVASVHPGSERHIDLLHIDLPSRDEVAVAQTPLETVAVQLDLTPKPAGGQENLVSGKFEISIEIRARNADAISYVTPVYWDGKWSSRPEMWDHLRIEPPREGP